MSVQESKQEEFTTDFKLFMKAMQDEFFKLKMDMEELKASSQFKLYKELQKLNQGPMHVKEYFDELHIAMLRAKVKESSKATMDRFLHGLNPDIAKQMKLYPYSDIQGMVSIAVEIEKLMRKKERNRAKEKIKEEKEAHGKILEEKRRIESKRENEFEVTNIIESDLSENKKNESKDQDKEYVKEEPFLDTNSLFPSDVLSSQQEHNYDDPTMIAPYGEYDPQESRTTLLQEEENDRGTSGVSCGVQQSIKVSIQGGNKVSHGSLGGIYNEQDVVYVIEEDSKQVQDPLHDIESPFSSRPEKSEMFERLEKIFSLQFASVMAYNVSIYVEGANEAVTMHIQAHMHAFTTPRSLSTWQSMKIHEIGVT